MRTVRLLILLGAAASATPSAAQSTSAADEQLRSVQACRSIADAGARLACFERESTPASGVASSAPPTQAAAEPALRPARTAPAPVAGGQADLSSARLVSLSEGTPGQWQFVLDNGMCWKMTEGRSALDLPKRGTPIAVRHTALGGYLLDRGAGVSLRVAPVG
jgi:hypothetical protein